MAKSSLSLPIFSLVLLLLSFNSGGTLRQANGMKTWCVAKPSSSEAELAANFDYACNQVDCGKVLCEGCPCNNPNTLMNTASIAMNLYYQTMGKNNWNCDFRGSGLFVVSDPSYGDCIYQYTLP